jgi:hypothetical protein
LTPSRLRSQTVTTPKSPREAPPKRGAASVFAESRESVNAGNRANMGTRGSVAEEGAEDEKQNQRGSWFVDHVLRASRLSNASSLPPRRSTLIPPAEDKEMNEGLGPASPQSLLSPPFERSSQRLPRAVESPEPGRRSTSSEALSIAGSLSQVNVIIPREVRSGLGQALASQEQVRRQEEREERIEKAQRRDSGSYAPTDRMSVRTLHHNEIVEHLDVIGKLTLRSMFSRNNDTDLIYCCHWFVDARIATVSHLSNAANSILV